MKFALSIVATISLAALQANAYSTGLETIYGYVCSSEAQVEYDPTDSSATSTLYTDNSIWQFVTGFALGEQLQQGATTSTCFSQAYQTKTFLDDVCDQLYTIGYNLYNLDFSTFQTDIATLTLDFNNLLIQYNDQSIGCQTQNKIVQFATRTQTVSGFSNWMFTIFYGTFYNMIQTIPTYGAYLPQIADQPMYTAVMYIYGQIYDFYTSGYTTTMNCQLIGYYAGQWLAESLSTYVETTVALVQIQGM